MPTQADISNTAIIVAGLIAAGALYIVYDTLRRKDQGFGPNSTRAFAIAIFIPMIVIIGASLDLKSEAIAAILGTLAGYIFSKTGQDEDKAGEDKGKK